jgi:hypothetical protein
MYAQVLETAFLDSLRRALRACLRETVANTFQDSGNAAAHWLFVDESGNRFDHELMRPTDMRVTRGATSPDRMVGSRRDKRTDKGLGGRTAYYKVALETSKYINQLRSSGLPRGIYLYNSVQELGPKPYVSAINNSDRGMSFDEAAKKGMAAFEETMTAELQTIGSRARRRRVTG